MLEIKVDTSGINDSSYVSTILNQTEIFNKKSTVVKVNFNLSDYTKYPETTTWSRKFARTFELSQHFRIAPKWDEAGFFTIAANFSEGISKTLTEPRLVRQQGISILGLPPMNRIIITLMADVSYGVKVPFNATIEMTKWDAITELGIKSVIHVPGVWRGNLIRNIRLNYQNFPLEYSWLEWFMSLRGYRGGKTPRRSTVLNPLN